MPFGQDFGVEMNLFKSNRTHNSMSAIVDCDLFYYYIANT